MRGKTGGDDRGSEAGDCGGETENAERIVNTLRSVEIVTNLRVV